MNEETDKKAKVDAIKQRKLKVSFCFNPQELRNLGVPDKYCTEVQRQIYTTTKHMFSNAAHH